MSYHILRLMVRLGFHGKLHREAIKVLYKKLHDMGLGD